eukprot:859668-Amphidinium_carterae.1
MRDGIGELFAQRDNQTTKHSAMIPQAKGLQDIDVATCETGSTRGPQPQMRGQWLQRQAVLHTE